MYTVLCLFLISSRLYFCLYFNWLMAYPVCFTHCRQLIPFLHMPPLLNPTLGHIGVILDNTTLGRLHGLFLADRCINFCLHQIENLKNLISLWSICCTITVRRITKSMIGLALRQRWIIYRDRSLAIKRSISSVRGKLLLLIFAKKNRCCKSYKKPQK